jgi:HPt (histidine-containing phosphotransfer) domain-containing protein
MSNPDDARAIVNIDELKEIMDNDMELIRECFTDFVQDWPQLYVQIKGAILEKNGKTLEESSHKLKGTLRYLAAENAAQAAYALETAGNGNDFDGVEAKLENLKTECQNVVQYIQAFDA